MAGIYLHIPFCKQACHYCDFHFSTNLSLTDEISSAMMREIEIQKSYLKDNLIETIYFGGGTPSILSAKQLSDLLNTIRVAFQVSDNAEITVEANPDDLTKEKLFQLKEAGINRLSIGIQTFDDDVLRFLNRAHDKNAAIQCMDDARKAGFKNISIDLIYAIPGQDNDMWLRNIEQAIVLNPEHISSYSLTIEEKTVFGKWSATGKLKPVIDDVAAQQLEILVEQLERAGFDQYEVSNFGKPGFYSAHNSSYWKQQPYLGIGPSAHSYNGISRQYNISNNHIYLRTLNEGKIPCEIEALTREDHVNEYLLTTLRTSWGTDLAKLKTDYQYDLKADHHEYLDKLLSQRLADINNDVFRLTKAGKLLADKIASDLFLIRD
ncbi:MAG TPA: radical SAM family heme chaperone HemW [Cyclobacteriaceae bacterium]|nr:radical SAM family heme chaperone HemW [Cyclobacteriaceae bacterium]